MAEFTGVDPDGLAYEVGHVVGVDGAVVVSLRVLLGQKERLAYSAVLMEGGQVEAGVKPIAPATAEHEPAGVAAPVVEALGVGAVGSGEGTGLLVGEVEQP